MPKTKNTFHTYFLALSLWLISVVLLIIFFSNEFEKKFGDISSSKFREALMEYNAIDRLGKVNQELSTSYMKEPSDFWKNDSTPKPMENTIQQKLDSINAAFKLLYEGNDSLLLNGGSADKADIGRIQKSIEQFYSTFSHQSLTRSQYRKIGEIQSIIDNRILLLHEHTKSKVEKLLLVLVKIVQPYYVLLLVALLLFGMLYWFLTILFYGYTGQYGHEEQKKGALQELDFTKFYIVFLIVFLFPVLKPLQQDDIRFDNPLWAMGSGIKKALGNSDLQPTRPPVINCNCDDPDTIFTTEAETVNLENVEYFLESIMDTLNNRKLDLQPIIDKIDEEAENTNNKVRSVKVQ